MIRRSFISFITYITRDFLDVKRETVSQQNHESEVDLPITTYCTEVNYRVLKGPVSVVLFFIVDSLFFIILYFYVPKDPKNNATDHGEEAEFYL